jgi:DNA-binding MarR family transcriptional regulator
MIPHDADAAAARSTVAPCVALVVEPSYCFRHYFGGSDLLRPGARMKSPIGKSIGWALVHAARLHRTRMGEQLAELGLFPGQEQVLQALSSAGPMTMGELAELLRVRPPTASKTIARLAAQGLVERQAEPGDARVVRVQLTKAGAERAISIGERWDAVEAELLVGLDNKDRKRFRRLLRRAARNLSDKAVEGDSADEDFEDLAQPKDSV